MTASALPARGAPTAAPRRNLLIGLGLLLAMYLNALLPTGLSWDYDTPSDMLEGSLALKLQWSPLFLIAVLMVWRSGWASWRHHLRLNPFLWLILLLAAASMAWSPLPGVTLKKVVQLVGLYALCITITSVARPTPLQWVRLALLCFLGIMAASVVMVIVNPALGTESVAGLTGSWRGVLDQKNSLGMVAALALMFGVIHRCSTPTPVWQQLAAGSLILLCLVMARSSTAMTVAALGSASYLLLRRDHLRSPLWLQRLLVVALVLVLLILQGFFIVHSRMPAWVELIEPVANLFGKNADLTGRSDIWAYMWPVIGEHWVLGSGYGAFWLGPGSPSQVILDEFYWTPYQAHNGYIDVLNELGAVGLLTLLVAIGLQIRNMLRLGRTDRNTAAVHSALLIIVLFANITESSLFRGLNFMHIFHLMSCFLVNQQCWLADQAAAQTRGRP